MRKAVALAMMTVPFLPTVKGRVIQAELEIAHVEPKGNVMSSIKRKGFNCEF